MEQFVIVLVVNITLATIFWWVHKTYDYLGTRWVLVTMTLVLPFFGILYFVILSVQRAFGKKRISVDIKNDNGVS